MREKKLHNARMLEFCNRETKTLTLHEKKIVYYSHSWRNGSNSRSSYFETSHTVMITIDSLLDLVKPETS